MDVAAVWPRFPDGRALFRHWWYEGPPFSGGKSCSARGRSGASHSPALKGVLLRAMTVQICGPSPFQAGGQGWRHHYWPQPQGNAWVVAGNGKRRASAAIGSKRVNSGEWTSGKGLVAA